MSSTDQPRSAEAFVTAMAPGEFLRRAGDLRELLQHPGYAFLEELIAIEAAGIRERAKGTDPLILAQQIAKDPTAAATKLAGAGGEARGLEKFQAFAGRILSKAKTVQDLIEREGEK